MKAATILLLAVTVFTGLLQQSSAAPNLGKIDGGVDINIEVVRDINVKPIDDVFKYLLNVIYKKLVEDITAIKNTLSELPEGLRTLTGEAKEEIEAAVAQYVATIDQFKDICAKMLNNNIEENKAALEQVKAELEECLSNIKAITQKCGEDVIAEYSFFESTYANAIEVVDSYESKLTEACKAQLAKMNGGDVIISDKFKIFLSKNIQNSNECLAKIMKAMEDGGNDATGDKKVAMENFKTFMVSFQYSCDDLHSQLASAALSDNITGLQKLVLPINKVIADTKQQMPELFKNLEEPMRHTIEENLVKILTDGVIVNDCINNDFPVNTAT